MPPANSNRKKLYEQKEGLAVDYCVICRGAAQVEVRQVLAQTHFCEIGIGKGELVERRCQCLDCGSEWTLQPGTIQTAVNPASPISPSTLLAETFPHFTTFYADRLRLDATIRRDPHSLDKKTRQSLILEPFVFLEGDVEREAKNTGGLGNALGGLGCLTAIAFALATIGAFANHKWLYALAEMAISVALGWAVMRLHHIRERRFVRAKLYPRLARCLAPLDPGPGELDGAAIFLNQLSYPDPALASLNGKIPQALNLLKVNEFLPIMLRVQAQQEQKAKADSDTAARER